MSELEDKYRRRFGERQSAAGINLEAARSVSPDEAAEGIRAANDAGLPEAAGAYSGLKTDETLVNKYRLQQAKKTGEWFQRPENAAVAQDDIEALTAMEKQFGLMKRPQADLELQTRAGFRIAAEKLRAEQDMARGITATQAMDAVAKDRTLGQQVAGFGRAAAVGLGPRFAQQAYGAASIPFDVLSGLVGAPATDIGLLPQDPFAVAAAGFRGLSEESRLAAEAWRGDQTNVGKIEGSIASGVESLTNMAPALGLSLLAGNPTPMLQLMTGQVGGEEYAKAREAGLSVPQSVVYGSSQAGVELLTERIPAAKLFTDLKVGSSLFKTFINNQIREQPTEQVATVLQDLNEWAALNPDKPFSAYIAERPEAAAQTAIATLVASGAMTTAAYGAEKGFNLLSTPAEKTAAQQQAQALQQLTDMVSKSKLATRSPEKFRDFVDRLAPEIQEIRVPVEAWQGLFQSKEADPAKAFEDAGGSLEAFQEAQALGTDLVIPIGNFLTRLAPEDQKALSDKVRTTPDSMNAEESAQWEKDREKFLAEAAGLLSEETATDSSTQVYDDVLGQLLATGMEHGAAERQAQLYQARYRARAARVGRDAFELYQQSNPLIQLGAAPEPGSDALEKGKLEQGQGLSAVEAKAKEAGAKLDVYENNGTITLSRIVVPEDARESGIGSSIMKELAAYADATGQRIALSPSADFGGNPKRLREFYSRFGFKENKGRGRDFSVSETMLREPKTLKQYANGPRGTFQPRRLSESQRAVITLTKARNRSTFLHESGHLWLEELAEDAAFVLAIPEDQRTPEQQAVATDMQAALDWFGVESLEAWNAMDLEAQRDSHEKWARGFEQYLREGKAPSSELRQAFARFKQWLLRIYKQASDLNVKINDDIRGVFDRLLATDQELDQIQATLSPQVFATAEQAGMTDSEFAAYRKTAGKARLEAEEKLAKQVMAEQDRETQEWWKERRSEVKTEVEAEINQRPEYNALSFIQSGKLLTGDTEMEPIKLDRDSVYKLKGKDFAKDNLNGLYRVDGGMDPDMAAPLFGYDSGDALLDALVTARQNPRAEAIEAETDRRMLAQYGDLRNGNQAAEAAVQAVHNDSQGELLRAELKAIARKQAEVAPFVREAEQATRKEERAKADERVEAEKQKRRTEKSEARSARQRMEDMVQPLALFKAMAEELVARKRVAELRPYDYLLAERKAAKQAFAAASKGKYDDASRFKRQQLLNHELYRASTAALEKVGKAKDYLAKFDRAGIRQKIGTEGDFLQLIDAIRNQYGLARQNAAEPDSISKVQQQIADGLLEAPDKVAGRLGSTPLKDYRVATVEEIIGARDLVKQIETTARGEREITLFNQKIKLDDAAQELASAVRSNLKAQPVTLGAQTTEDKFGKAFSNFFTNITRTGMLSRRFDGTDSGPWTRMIVDPIRQAATKAEGMRVQVRQDLTDIFSKNFTPEQMEANNERTTDRSLGPLSRWDKISLALNWGNESNRKAVLDGMVNGQKPFTPQVMDRILSDLNPNELAFVQEVWDYIDSYWPELKAAQERRKGIAPPKVQAMPFTVNTASGPVQMRGGYYPLKYNRNIDAKARQHDSDDAFAKMTAGVLSSAQSKFAHNQQRVGSGGQPVLIDINLISRHLGQIVQDVAMGDSVIAVDKLLNHPEVRQSLIDSGELDTLQYLKLWLKDSATGEQAPADDASRMMQFLRANFTLSKMAFNISNQLLNVAGLAQTAAVIGPKNFASGVKAFTKDPVDAFRAMVGSSEFMRLRFNEDQFDKDIALLNQLLSAGPQDTAGSPIMRGILKGARAIRLNPTYIKWAYMGSRATQMLVDTVTWHGAQQGALDRGMSLEEAIRYADGIVDTAQTSGLFSSRSGIERGTLSETTRQSEWVKLWTTLGSYMIAKGNIAAEKYRNTDFKDPKSVLTFMTNIILLFMVDAIALAALRGGFPDDDDEEGWLWWSVKQLGEQAAGTIPILRELPAALKGYGSGGGPVGALLGDVGRVVTQTSQAENDAALYKAYINLVGDLTGLPSAQINRGIGAWWADNEGEDVAPYEYILGQRKE